MDPSLRSFRGKKPMECHALNDIKYSVSGDKILVIANTATFKVLGRDGDEMWESIKGDQYVLDQTRNKGHINQVSISNLSFCKKDFIAQFKKKEHSHNLSPPRSTPVAGTPS